MKRLILNIFLDPFFIVKYFYWQIKIFFLKRKGIKTIVYNLHHDYFFDIFNPIYKRLKDNKNIEIFFSYKFRRSKLKKYLLKKIPGKQLIQSSISPYIKFDLFITAEVTGPDFPFSRLKTKTLEIYHGTGIYNLHEKKDVLSRFDIHFSIGPQYCKSIKDIYLNQSKNYKVYRVGYPKLDIFFQSEETNQPENEKNKPVILYAPHWNESGSIHRFNEQIILELAKFDAEILVKPHNYLFVKYKKENWYERLYNLQSKYHNIKFIENPDTQSLYNIADFMITDVGTTNGFEFSLLKKPVILYYNMEWFRDKINTEVEEKICQMSLEFTNLKELYDICGRIIKNDKPTKDLLKNQRKQQQQLIDNHLYNFGHSTDIATDIIIKELDFE